MTLYIIGNGFDLAHNLETSYIDFYNYLKDLEYHYEDLFLYDLNEIFPELDDNDINWSNFEAQLSNFSVSSDIKDGIKDNLKTLECYKEDFDEYELVSTFCKPHLKKYNDTIAILHQQFRVWISEININNSKPKFKLDHNSVYLNFNYTHTLEILYGIKESGVHHIHGKVGDDGLVIGHSWDYNVSPNPLEGRFVKTLDNEIIDTLDGVIIEESGVRQILQQNESSESDKRIFYEFRDEIILPLRKSCTDIIESSVFFDELENLKIKDIYILGHSLSGVDMPYFEEIVSRIDNLNWIITYYNENDIHRIETFKKRLSLSNDHCKAIKINELLM